MHVRNHVAEQFVVHLGRLKNIGQSLRHPVDFLDQLLACRPVKMKQLGDMLLAENETVTGEKLIPVEGDVTML